MASNLNLRTYLDRIRYSGPHSPSADVLRTLHRAHMFAVPFENLDIHIGRRIVCEEARFLHKIIHEFRGGFCYELNGAFAALLRELGFEVTLLSARVSRPDGTEGPDFDHLCLLVRLPGAPREEAWLADVGFGDSFVEPLRFALDIEQVQFGRAYLLTKNGDRFQLKSGPQQKRQPEYSFTLEPRHLSDFAAMCHYHQTSPDSHFTQRRLCSRATPDGRITLSGLTLIETRTGQRKETTLPGEVEWRAKLKELFQVELPDNHGTESTQKAPGSEVTL